MRTPSQPRRKRVGKHREAPADRGVAEPYGTPDESPGFNEARPLGVNVGPVPADVERKEPREHANDHITQGEPSRLGLPGSYVDQASWKRLTLDECFKACILLAREHGFEVVDLKLRQPLCSNGHLTMSRKPLHYAAPNASGLTLCGRQIRRVGARQLHVPVPELARVCSQCAKGAKR